MKELSEKMLATEQEEDFSVLRQDRLYKEKWVDRQGLLHRDDGGPASIDLSGRQDWYIHGTRHRVGGPAFISKDFEGWQQNSKYHREDGPAFRYRMRDGIGYLISRDYYCLNGIAVSEEEVRKLGKMKDK